MRRGGISPAILGLDGGSRLPNADASGPRVTGDGAEHTSREVRDRVANSLHLPERDLEAREPVHSRRAARSERCGRAGNPVGVIQAQVAGVVEVLDREAEAHRQLRECRDVGSCFEEARERQFVVSWSGGCASTDRARAWPRRRSERRAASAFAAASSVRLPPALIVVSSYREVRKSKPGASICVMRIGFLMVCSAIHASAASTSARPSSPPMTSP